MIACSQSLISPSSISLLPIHFQPERFQLNWQGYGPMRFERRACRWFQLPFASDCAYAVLRGGFQSANVDCIGEWIDALNVVGFDPRRTSTLRRCLATGLAIHRFRLRSLRLPARSLPPSKNRNSAIVASSVLLRASCPDYGYARSYGHRALRTRGG
jgi:hypothetical protein